MRGSFDCGWKRVSQRDDPRWKNGYVWDRRQLRFSSWFVCEHLPAGTISPIKSRYDWLLENRFGRPNRLCLEQLYLLAPCDQIRLDRLLHRAIKHGCCEVTFIVSLQIWVRWAGNFGSVAIKGNALSWKNWRINRSRPYWSIQRSQVQILRSFCDWCCDCELTYRHKRHEHRH